MADGAAAAAERPPFSSAALDTAGASAGSQTEEVGHNIPMMTGSEPVADGEVADAPVADASDTDTEPTAPALATPGGMTPMNPSNTELATGPGVVNDASALDAGLPPATAQPTEVSNVTAFPGTQTVTPEIAPAADPSATAASEAPSNITAFPTPSAATTDLPKAA